MATKAPALAQHVRLGLPNGPETVQNGWLCPCSSIWKEPGSRDEVTHPGPLLWMISSWSKWLHSVERRVTEKHIAASGCDSQCCWWKMEGGRSWADGYTSSVGTVDAIVLTLKTVSFGIIIIPMSTPTTIAGAMPTNTNTARCNSGRATAFWIGKR